MFSSPNRANKIALVLFSLLLAISSLVFFASLADQSFANETLTVNSHTLYLVRHAEKQDDSNNPPLTACGLQRANQLAMLLSQAKIKKIYSTSYLRTMATAEPLAFQQKLPIEKYSPDDLRLFAEKLKSNKQNTLVVGHSNTTAKLAEIITNQPLKDINDKEYQLLYQIHGTNNNFKLTVLKQPLSCI